MTKKNRAQRRAAGRVTPTRAEQEMQRALEWDDAVMRKAVEILEGEEVEAGGDPTLSEIELFAEWERGRQHRFLSLVSAARADGHSWKVLAALFEVEPASLEMRYRRATQAFDREYGVGTDVS